MARPTKLTKELINKAEAFVDARIADRVLLPTVEGLALELEVNRDTVYAWCEVPTDFNVPANTTPEILKDWEQECTQKRELHQEFSDIVSKLKAAQGEKLLQNGLTGKYNATIAKLILSGKHGYVEKSEQDVNHGGNVSFINTVPRPESDAN